MLFDKQLNRPSLITIWLYIYIYLYICHLRLIYQISVSVSEGFRTRKDSKAEWTDLTKHLVICIGSLATDMAIELS